MLTFFGIIISHIPADFAGNASNIAMLLIYIIPPAPWIAPNFAIGTYFYGCLAHKELHGIEHLRALRRQMVIRAIEQPAGILRLIEGSGYAPAANWAFGDTFNAYVLEGQPADANAKTAEINNSAMASTILGFVFDTEPVKSEIASVSKVVQEYEGLLGGELPVEETNAEFVEKLKIAGIDTVIAEMQRQVDAFMASK